MMSHYLHCLCPGRLLYRVGRHQHFCPVSSAGPYRHTLNHQNYLKFSRKYTVAVQNLQRLTHNSLPGRESSDQVESIFGSHVPHGSDSGLSRIVSGKQDHGVDIDRYGQLRIISEKHSRQKYRTALILSRASQSLTEYDFLRLLGQSTAEGSISRRGLEQGDCTCPVLLLLGEMLMGLAQLFPFAIIEHFNGAVPGYSSSHRQRKLKTIKIRPQSSDIWLRNTRHQINPLQRFICHLTILRNDK